MFTLLGLLMACASSPSDDLARAQSDLVRLEKLGVADYLPEQVTFIRENLRIAREFIQRNRFELANGPLSLARATLDSCAHALVAMRFSAKGKSESQFVQLQSGLDSLATLLEKMPRRSYLDQNRYDLHSIRLKELRQRIVAMREEIERKAYPQALRQGQAIERHLRKSLAAVRQNSSEAIVAVSSN